MYYPNRDNAEDGQSSIHRAYIGWDGLVSNLAMRSHSRRIAQSIQLFMHGFELRAGRALDVPHRLVLALRRLEEDVVLTGLDHGSHFEWCQVLKAVAENGISFSEKDCVQCVGFKSTGCILGLRTRVIESRDGSLRRLAGWGEGV
eukprot:COSAG01_NODE_3409_length_6127_cov_19.096384_3_plen_145_part_00